MDLLTIVLIVAISLILSAVALKTGMLTPDGAVAAFIVLATIGLMGGFPWLLMLVLFAAIGFLATKVAFSSKKDKGIQEGKEGERGWKNILGVALAPVVVAVLNFILPGNYEVLAVAYIATIAVAASDTVASEIGVKDPRVWLITTFKRVNAGDNGGISVFGSAISLVASLAVSLLGWIVIFYDISWMFLIPAVAGMLGNLLDSFLGATVEGRYISKFTNNFITGICGGILAAVIFIQF